MDSFVKQPNSKLLIQWTLAPKVGQFGRRVWLDSKMQSDRPKQAWSPTWIPRAQHKYDPTLAPALPSLSSNTLWHLEGARFWYRLLPNFLLRGVQCIMLSMGAVFPCGGMWILRPRLVNDTIEQRFRLQASNTSDFWTNWNIARSRKLEVHGKLIQVHCMSNAINIIKLSSSTLQPGWIPCSVSQWRKQSHLTAPVRRLVGWSPAAQAVSTESLAKSWKL